MKMPNYKTIELLLTNDCNNHCSFCYRSHITNTDSMSIAMVDKIMDFILTELPIDENLIITFWGGEPLLNFNVIKHLTSNYQQLTYHIVTNGSLLDKNMFDYFLTLTQLDIVWSLGDSIENFGSVKNKLNQCELMTRLIKEKYQTVNLMLNTDTFYDDFSYVFYNLTHNICIDAPRMGQIFSDNELSKMTAQLLKSLIAFYGKANFGDIIDNCLTENFYPPTCGIEKIMIDFDGIIWRCDGAYRNNIDRYGDIYSGINYNKLDFLWNLRSNPEATILKNCVECEIYKRCPRHICMGDNLQSTGNIFNINSGFCQVNKAIYKAVQQYKELYGKSVFCGQV